MTEDSLPDTLNEYFEGGWRIAPFVKTPDGYIGVSAWPKRAARNHAELQTLIEEQRKKTSRQLVYGVVPVPGRYIVDIDLKNNPAALQLWKDRVVEAYGDMSLAMPNLIVKTKSGGFHLYYSDGTDRVIHSPTDAFGRGSGVDIRGATGMVIAATSIGSVDEWQPGEYTIVRGRPTDPLSVLGLQKILGDSYSKEDHVVKSVLTRVNEALRNDSVAEALRYRLLPDDLVIPQSSRDNTLYRCARLCRLAGLSQESATSFMNFLATRCEVSESEPVSHWQALAADKVRRVYSSDSELQLKTISALYEELDNCGAVLLRSVSKSYWYFRHGSTILRLEPRTKYSTDNIGNVFQGMEIRTEEGPIPIRKVLSSYSPREVASNTAMYPRTNAPFYVYEDQRFVNTYHDPFAAFEPSDIMLERASPYVERFTNFCLHITGYDREDADHFLNKLAWLVQRPYRKLPTGTIIYSHTKGTGKDVMMSLVRQLIGPQYYMPINFKSIEGEHVPLHDKLVCVASEVQLQANARGTVAASNFLGRLKDLVTAKTVYVNEKFVPAYSAPFFAHFFLLSNFELSSVLEPGDRRWDIFHAAEEKFDQNMFGALADIGNDNVWEDRNETDRLLRRHVIFAIRRYLQGRTVSMEFDREEARVNEVKRMMMEHQHPPAIDWLRRNLPTYFTEDVAMMACHFCPMKTSPEYVVKQLREHFGPEFVSVYRKDRMIYRLNGAPRLERVSDGSMGTMVVLNTSISTSDSAAKKPLYTFASNVRDVAPSDAVVKTEIRNWYESMSKRFYGNTIKLPAMKPDIVGDA